MVISIHEKIAYPDSKVHGANMGPTWVLWAPDGPHVGPMNLAIRVFIEKSGPILSHILNIPSMCCLSMWLGGHQLTHWGRVTHICVSKLTIIGSDNGLSPDRRQAIVWTNAGLLLIGPLGTNFSDILIEILAFSFKKIRLKVSSAKRRPQCVNSAWGCSFSSGRGWTPWWKGNKSPT